MSTRPKPKVEVISVPSEYEERFRQMAENIQEIFWMLDAKTQQVIYVSPAYEQICGRTCASLYEAPLSYVEHIHPDDRERVLARLARLAEGAELDEEFRIFHANGDIRWVANQGFPILDNAGKIYRLAGVVQDISKRKQIEQELRQSEERFQTAFRSSPCSMSIIKLPEARFVDVNKTFESESGFTREEVIGHTTLELGMWVNADARAAALKELQHRGSLKNREHQFRAKTGEVRTVLYSAEMIEMGGTEYVLTTGKDITSRIRTEEALRRSEAEYRSLFEGAPYGILRATVSGQILRANPALVRILGYGTEAELLETDLADDVFGDFTDFEALISAHEKTQKFENEPLHWKRRDGTQICVEASGRIFDNETGAQRCVDMMVQDVTERHALEAKARHAEVMEEVTEITCGLAHDYSTHLGRMLGYADLLLHMPEVNGISRDYAEQIFEAGMQARSVTRCLLGMTSKQELATETTRVCDLIEDIQEFLRVFFGPEIQVSIEIDTDTGVVRGDPQKLTQVIFGLVANARDAMPQGGTVTIKVGTMEIGRNVQDTTLQPGNYAMISVSDTGGGMDEGMQSRIFDPFFTTKPEGKGCGLGLSYAQVIIENQSGGEIRVYSQPGRGSTFTIYLPYVSQGEGLRRKTKPLTTKSAPKTVLVVTGDDVLRRLASEFLNRGGFNVLSARQGSEVLREIGLQKTPVHLLLTDLVTLGKSGVELACEVVSTSPHLRVIYMADYGELSGPFNFLRPDGSILLQKPFLSFELIAKVRSMLAESQQLGIAI